MKNIYTASIIGTGRIGFLLGFDKKREQPAAHTQALLKNKRVKIIAGCDRNEDRLTQWSRFCKNTETFADYKKLCRNTKSDIIVVAVNEEDHTKVACEAIKSCPGILILEKPVATNMKEAQKIAYFSNKYNVPVLINHERRYSADYHMVKKIIDSGKLGDIHSVRASLWSGLCVYSKERESSGGYSLLHDGTHLVDIVLFLLGEKISPRELGKVSVTGYKKDKNHDIRELEFAVKSNNLYAHFEISGNKKYFGFEIEIIGSLGRAVVGNGYLDVFTAKESKFYSGFHSLTKEKRLKRPKKTHFFTNMIGNAVDYLDGKHEIVSTLEDGIMTLDLIMKIKNILKKKQSF